MARKYKSDIARAMHCTMTDLHEIGVVDKTTIRGFDRMCLTRTEKLAAAEIRATSPRACAVRWPSRSPIADAVAC